MPALPRWLCLCPNNFREAFKCPCGVSSPLRVNVFQKDSAWVCAFLAHGWHELSTSLSSATCGQMVDTVSGTSSHHLMPSILRRPVTWKWLSCLACLIHNPRSTGTQKGNGSHSSVDLQFCSWMVSSTLPHTGAQSTKSTTLLFCS